MNRIQRIWFGKFPPKTKSVTRGSKWGNPFKIIQEDGVYYVKDGQGNYWGNNNEGYATKEEAAKKAVSCFKGWLAGKVMSKELDLSEFDGVENVACFCKTHETCHGDVIIDFVNRHREGETLF